MITKRQQQDIEDRRINQTVEMINQAKDIGLTLRAFYHDVENKQFMEKLVFKLIHGETFK